MVFANYMSAFLNPIHLKFHINEHFRNFLNLLVTISIKIVLTLKKIDTG